MIDPISAWVQYLRLLGQWFNPAPPQLPPPAPSYLSLPFDQLPPHQISYGQTRTGKSLWYEHLYTAVLEARLAGETDAGAVFFDVHDASFRNLQGRIALLALDYPEIYDLYIPIDPTNPNWTVRYNPLEPTGDQLPEERAAILANTIMRVWDDDPTVTVHLAQVLEHGFHTLNEAGLGIDFFKRLLGDKSFRENILFELKNPVLDEYWSSQWYPSRPGKEFREFVASTIHRIEPLTKGRMADVFRPPPSFDFRRNILNSGLFVNVNGAVSVLGRRPAYLFNAMVLEELAQAFFSRRDIPEHERRLMFVFCDEFQNYSTVSLDEILTEGGKYKCDLNLATQTVIEDGKKKALQEKVLKSVSRIASFRVSGSDADILQAEFGHSPIDSVKFVRQNWQKPFGIDTLYEEPVFRPLSETAETARREILNLPNRFYLFKARGMGETRLLRTPDVPDIADLPNARHLPEALERLDREAFERWGVLRNERSTPSNTHRSFYLPRLGTGTDDGDFSPLEDIDE